MQVILGGHLIVVFEN